MYFFNSLLDISKASNLFTKDISSGFWFELLQIKRKSANIYRFFSTNANQSWPTHVFACTVSNNNIIACEMNQLNSLVAWLPFSTQ